MTDPLKDDPFTKTQFAMRIDILEAEIKQNRIHLADRQKQVAEMARAFKSLSGQLTKVAQVTNIEVESFLKSLCVYIGEDPRGESLRSWQTERGFKAAVKQALRDYGVKLMRDGGDIKQA